MKKCIPYIFCFFIQVCGCPTVLAQNQHKIDSLLNVFKITEEDSTKAKILNAVSRLYWQVSDNTQSRKYAGDALTLSEEINFGIGIIDAHTNIGITYVNQGDYDEALKIFLKVIKISEDIPNKKGMAMGYLECGNIYYYRGDYPAALNSFLRAQKIYEEIGDQEGITSGYISMGVINYQQKNYTDAIASFLAALNTEYIKDDSLLFAGCHINLGLVYADQKNYPAAIESNSIALRIMEKIGDRRSTWNCYQNIGELYRKQKDYVNALQYSRKALQIAEEIKDKKAISMTYTNLGNINIGLKQYPEARKYLEDGLAISKEIGAKDAMYIIFNSLSVIDSLVGNFKGALDYYKLAVVYKDSLFNEDKNRQIEEMKTKYETSKKDDEILMLNKDKLVQEATIERHKLTRNIFIGGIAMLMIFFILFYRNHRTKQLLKLQTLRNQIASDLHDDVGSTLTSISIFSELAKAQSKEVIPILDSIGESSRKMLESMADIVWTINPENDNFEKIIWRMRSFAYELLAAKKIDFEFTADPTVSRMKLPMEVRKNLYLIFKEAIHNLVKYAGADRAVFTIDGTKNTLTMLIRDNGKGFDVNQASEGNGLKNMKKRAEEIGAKLLVESGAGVGTTIQLLLKTA